MVAIKPSSQLKHEEEIVIHGLSPWRKWFYISFAVVAYFLITVTMFHSHKLMSHHEETLLHGSPNSLTGHGHHHPHSHHPHGHGHSHPHHHGNNHYSHPSDPHSSKEWDFLIFTQHWPNTVCMQWNEKTGHGCNIPADKDMWSIHGIWPTKNNSMGPFFCTKDRFDPSLIEPITNDLNVYWLDVEKGRKKDDLWQHEWAKHGTCAQADPLLDSELKYFSQGLEWFKQYNMENILQKYQILPKAEEDGGVSVLDIWHAVKDTNGKTPIIRCETDQVTHKKYLFEIRICFDKNLQLQDCDCAKAVHKDEDFMYDDNISTNCPLGEPIFYPSRAPNPPEVSRKTDNRALSTLKSFRSYLQNLFMEKDSDNTAFQP